jgi:hypothetical protein
MKILQPRKFRHSIFWASGKRSNAGVIATYKYAEYLRWLLLNRGRAIRARTPGQVEC